MTPEKQVENQIKAQLTKIGAYFYKNFGGPHSNKGIPDIVGTYGTPDHGQFFAIEVKRLKGGNPTPVQIRHLTQIARNGGVAIISASTDSVTLLQQLVHGDPISVPVDVAKLTHPIEDVELAHQIWHHRLTIPDCQTVLITFESDGADD